MAAISELVLLALSLSALNSWRDYSPESTPEEFDDTATKYKSSYSAQENLRDANNVAKQSQSPYSRKGNYASAMESRSPFDASEIFDDVAMESKSTSNQQSAFDDTVMESKSRFFDMLGIFDNSALESGSTFDIHENWRDAVVEPRSLYDLLENFPTDKDIECPESDSKMRFPGQCSRYITCRNFRAHIRTCPPGMSFDHKYGHCRLAFEVDCEDELPAPIMCGENEVYTACGSSCERNCDNLHKQLDCEYVCVERCKCRLGYVRDAENGKCIQPVSCENANSLSYFFKND